MSNKANFWKMKTSKTKQFARQPVASDKPMPKTTHMWTYGTGNTSPKIKIATWNVNGIRAVYKRRFL